MLKRLEDILKDLEVNKRLVREIKDFCEEYNLVYTVETDGKNIRGIEDIRNIKREDKKESLEGLRYLELDSIVDVIGDMLASDMYNTCFIQSNFEGIDLIDFINRVGFLYLTREYFKTFI